MDNPEIIKKVTDWQNASFVHPLTCGNDSGHQNLVPKEIDNCVVLACLDCSYVQEHIPQKVLSNYVERMKAWLISNSYSDH